MGFILGLIVVAVAVIVLGLVIHGLFNLLFVGVVLLVLSLIFAAMRSRRRQRR